VAFENTANLRYRWRNPITNLLNELTKADPILSKAHPHLLEKTLYDVSTPGSARYGHYLEQDAIKQEILKPSEQDRKAVLDWLKRSGVKITRDSGEQIQFLTTVERANSMLGTSFRTYQKESEPAERMIRTLEVKLPHDVIENIDLIHPTTYFDQIKPLRSTIHKASVLEDVDTAAPEQGVCSGGITPSCLAQLYDIKGFTISDPSKTGRIGVPGFLGQIAQFSDLAKFISSVPSRAKMGTNFTSSTVNGEFVSLEMLVSPPPRNSPLRNTAWARNSRYH
jgi:tripeptidyl-peptidase-1